MAKILVIEDKHDDQITIKSVLESKKHEVKVANDGKEAMELLEEESNFDLIIIDIILPDISGIKLFEYVRDKFGKNVKCIFVTILPENEIEKEKIDGFVQKPYLPSELHSEINKCLKIKDRKY
jgi:CheY-like chemotaxis protein